MRQAEGHARELRKRRGAPPPCEGRGGGACFRAALYTGAAPPAGFWRQAEGHVREPHDRCSASDLVEICAKGAGPPLGFCDGQRGISELPNRRSAPRLASVTG